MRRWPALVLLKEHGGFFAGDPTQLELEIGSFFARNYEKATPRQLAALAEKPRPNTNFLAHTRSLRWRSRGSTKWKELRHTTAPRFATLLETPPLTRRGLWKLCKERSEILPSKGSPHP